MSRPKGLAPVIVAQVEEMLVASRRRKPTWPILVIEQNIGVATTISENVAIMVNGRINRIVELRRLAADRELQQRLLGVGRHSEAEPERGTASAAQEAAPHAPAAAKPSAAPIRIYVSNPSPPTRWSQPVPNARIEASARDRLGRRRPDRSRRRRLAPRRSTSGPPVVIVAGTLDTKGPELRFIRDLIVGERLAHAARRRFDEREARDLRRDGAGDRAQSWPRRVGACSAAIAALRSPRWRKRSRAGSGVRATSPASSAPAARAAPRSSRPAMRALPIGVPKMLISSIASGDVSRYVGPTDITMMYSVTDVQGLNSISRQVLANGAQALDRDGEGAAREREGRRGRCEAAATRAPSVGLTMFGVTTPCVQQIAATLAPDWECLVFHATGVGGRSMEKLIDSATISAVIDVTTTEVADMLMGGVLPADEDRFGAVIRTRTPYIGSVGALDMVNFGPPETVPAAYKDRLLHAHNPQVTLMRTTAAENDKIGRWIGERLNRMDGPVRFFLPELGVSALDQPGQAFHDPQADAALFARARTDGAADREPAIDPGQAPHQRSRILRRCRRRIPGAARRRPACAGGPARQQ